MAADFRTYREHSAWYAGDPGELASIYTRWQANRPADRPAQFRGGVVGRAARWFWGQPTPAGEQRSKLHVPLAGDMAGASSDLLFAEPLTLTVDDPTTQDRLDELAGESLDAQLAEAAEVCAALGGVFLRVAWDRTVSGRPWLAAVHPDAAVPEWSWGRLTAVTFWRRLPTERGPVLRLLERHEPGVILHGLYEGTDDQLGRRVPLTEHPEAAPLAAAVNADSAVETGVDTLTAVYVPNMRPNRTRRGSPLGRSDYQGVEPLMDAADEVYTSWMRDVRLGKARIVVPDSYLENLGPGQGALLDLDREVFVGLNALQRPEDGMQISPQQFAIRVDEHSRTVTDYIRQIVRSAGYSAQTFGEHADVAATATEVYARERRSYLTRDKKIRYWRPALADAVETLLAVDAAQFSTRITPERPHVDFGESTTESTLSLAQTAQALRAAEAASTETLVRLTHPDWTGDQVTEETQRIQAESGRAVDDPMQLGQLA
jgi:A118 family predicted phage portal protein